MNRKKYNHYSILSVVGLATLAFIYNDFLCSGESCYDLEVSVLEPFFWGLLSIIPTLLLLYAFSERILISWFKHIAWWIVLAGAWAVTNNENENDLSPFADDITIIGMLATLLFITTLIYALAMNRKLKNN